MKSGPVRSPGALSNCLGDPGPPQPPLLCKNKELMGDHGQAREMVVG